MLSQHELYALLASKRVLWLVSAFNGLSQHLYANLSPFFELTHCQVGVSIQQIQAYQPDLILCPYLLEYIPPEVYEQYPCFILHPGPAEKGGPSSLSWAILQGRVSHEISFLQAAPGWDQGPLWAKQNLKIYQASLAYHYRTQVTRLAPGLILQGLARFYSGDMPLSRGPSHYEPKIKPQDLAFDWEEPAKQIIKKIWAGDNQPGATASFNQQECHFYDAWDSDGQGTPGKVIQTQGHFVEIACGQGSLWVGRIQPPDGMKTRASLMLEEA